MNKKNEMCKHRNTETEGYLNSCSNAGCRLNGPITAHFNCGSQHREWCSDCGELLYDSALEQVATRLEVYMCSQCESDGIQPGHKYCGEHFVVPVGGLR